MYRINDRQGEPIDFAATSNSVKVTSDGTSSTVYKDSRCPAAASSATAAQAHASVVILAILAHIALNRQE